MTLLEWAREPSLYVNSTRQTPALGDVVDHAHPVVHGSGPWMFTQRGWVSKLGYPIRGRMPEGMRLVFDGSTRRQAP